MQTEEQIVTKDRTDEFIRAAFKELQARGGSANGSDVMEAIAPSLNLTPHELAKTNTGAVRWSNITRWVSTDCVKAGYLTKKDGIWTLTQAGVEALKLPPGQIVRSAARSYRDWRRNKGADDKVIPSPEPKPDTVDRSAVLDQAREQARKAIDEHIDDIGEYDFQRLVEELLRAMGYHVPFNAPPGPDGGVDLVAYKDPLGTVTPRIRVQVKHRDAKVDVKEVRELEGLLRKEGDIGLIVSSGGFTSTAIQEVRHSTRHIETMDRSRLISLWQEYYDSVRETGKAMLPLTKVFFLAPAED